MLGCWWWWWPSSRRLVAESSSPTPTTTRRSVILGMYVAMYVWITTADSSDGQSRQTRRYEPTIITESRLHLCPIASLVVPTAPTDHALGHQSIARCCRHHITSIIVTLDAAVCCTSARCRHARARRRVGRPPMARKQRRTSFKRMRARNSLTV